jgi:hypothetical protein
MAKVRDLDTLDEYAQASQRALMAYAQKRLHGKGYERLPKL